MFRNLVSAAKRVFQLQPPSQQHLFSLTTEKELAAWEHYSDKSFGGLSTSNFGLGSEGKAVFWGDLSLELDQDKVVRIKKSGFAGLNTKRDYGIFDLAPFDVIEMRLKGDGRAYMTSLRTENWVDRAIADDNSWHHVIHTSNDEWKIYKLAIKDYKRTWHGRVLEEQCEINLSRIVGMGIHVTARTTAGEIQGPGPYRLELDWMRAVRTKDFHRDF
ncbi:probable complex I intermediate-associated protein 30 [Selaginella moellendorffii]|uniref:probable complex I intermediate-associated protein 30 n=1 Tax=Selaginella moellendorffii TaxID=88036 RepID=UPI000D1CA4BC|nr:probable complex I intermediate-associated protein 30 [Selaginella moellendorffii]XP_024545562.1 probable complex I intermediate-associated protein 30 [Selaginella moellendorffii]|eukprot:XP_024545561.1 probable complex I intermediate-associated protein 30 [Selaginella moellendorffii]